MKVFNKMFGVMLAASMVACGTVDANLKTGDAAQEQQTTIDGIFEGYVLNAFEVTVDGEQYADLEDYYTQMVDSLPDMVAEAGYDNVDVAFDAPIGFSDLWSDMAVYIAPQGRVGHQINTNVNYNAGFRVILPAAAQDSALPPVYRVRANKRISLVLTDRDSGDATRICYNFSAREKYVDLSQLSGPVVLDSFESSITKYDCDQSDRRGLQIPQQQEKATSR